MNVWYGITVWQSDFVQSTIIAARTPITWSRFGDHMKWRRSRTVRSMNDAKLEHVIKFRFSNLERIRSKAARTAEDRRSGSANVMGDGMLNSGFVVTWTGNVRKFLQ